MRELYLHMQDYSLIILIGLDYILESCIFRNFNGLLLSSAFYGFYCEAFVTTCYKYLCLLHCRNFCLCISPKDIYATFYLESVTILIFIVFCVNRMCGCFMSIDSGLAWLSFRASQIVRYISTYRMFLKPSLFSL